MAKQDAISPKSEAENLKLEYVFGMRTDLKNSVNIILIVTLIIILKE